MKSFLIKPLFVLSVSAFCYSAELTIPHEPLITLSVTGMESSKAAEFVKHLYGIDIKMDDVTSKLVITFNHENVPLDKFVLEWAGIVRCKVRYDSGVIIFDRISKKN